MGGDCDRVAMAEPGAPAGVHLQTVDETRVGSMAMGSGSMEWDVDEPHHPRAGRLAAAMA